VSYSAPRSGLRTALLLLVCSLAVYNANFQRIASGDTVAASLLPFSLLLDGSVAADRFYPYVAEHLPQHARGFHLAHGHAYSGYPIATPLLVTPLYVPAALAAGAQRWGVARIVAVAAVMEKLAASLVAALSVMFFYFLAWRLASPRRALCVTLAYAFATGTWTISSQALWQHGPSELAVIAGLYFLARWSEDPGRRGMLALAGLSCAVAAAVRPTNVLFLAALCISAAAARRGRCRWADLLALPVVVGTSVAAYNLYVFGRLTGGYEFRIAGPFWEGLAGLLASPGRGLFVYTPVAAFSLVGAARWLKNGRPWQSPVPAAAALFALWSVLLFSIWPIWWGGHCYGPRLLTDMVPCLMILILPALEGISRSAAQKALLGLALTVSILVQAIGAFCYPHSQWDEQPVTVGDRPDRLWDWRDSPIGRSLRAGPRLGPDPAKLEEFWQALRGAPGDPAQP
jgi:MFS family permease